MIAAVWQEIPPLAKMGKSAVAFSIAAKPKGVRRPRQMFVVVRPTLLPEGLPWWHPGAFVSVAIGGEMNEGVLRITPGGQHKLLYCGKNSEVAVLRLPAFGWIKSPHFATADVEFDHHPEWLQIELPDWALRVKRPIAPATPRPGVAR